jgi:hypothetical protein
MKTSRTEMTVGAALVGFAFVGVGVAPGCGSSSNGGGSTDAASGHETGADGPVVPHESGGNEAASNEAASNEAGSNEAGSSEDGSDDGGGVTEGGATEGGSPACSAAPPSSPTIIGSTYSVSDSGTGQIRYGATGSTQWVTYTYEATGQPTPTLTATDSGLNVVGSLVVPDGGAVYAGAGVAFAAATCLDVSAYSGVQFTLSGSLGDCRLAFIENLSQDTTAANDPNRGMCTATPCYGPSYPVTSLGTMTVPFTALTGGMPVGTVDTTQLTSMQWQLALPAASSDGGRAGCSVNFTISDVSFVGVSDAGADDGGTEAGGDDGGSDGSTAPDGDDGGSDGSAAPDGDDGGSDGSAAPDGDDGGSDGSAAPDGDDGGSDGPAAPDGDDGG